MKKPSFPHRCLGSSRAELSKSKETSSRDEFLFEYKIKSILSNSALTDFKLFEYTALIQKPLTKNHFSELLVLLLSLVEIPPVSN